MDSRAENIAWAYDVLRRTDLAGTLRDGGGAGEPAVWHLRVPMLGLDHPHLDDAYALLCCFYFDWCTAAYCRLEVARERVIVHVEYRHGDALGFEGLMRSLKTCEQYFS